MESLNQRASSLSSTQVFIFQSAGLTKGGEQARHYPRVLLYHFLLQKQRMDHGNNLLQGRINDAVFPSGRARFRRTVRESVPSPPYLK